MKKRRLKWIMRGIISTTLMVSLFGGGCFVMRHLFQQSILSEANQLNKNGGISEVREVVLGEISQYIAIEGEGTDQPICLFLHGGPGLSVPYGISSRNQLETLQSHCTVVYWDQRGAGKTYSANPDEVFFSYDQLEQDAKELIAYLRNEFEVEKIYLIGYSWGSVLGMRLVQTIPDQLYAYFGLSQVINPSQSEQELYTWLLEEFKLTNQAQLVSELNQLGPPPYQTMSQYETFQQILTKSNAYVKWKEGIPNVNVLSWIWQVLICPDLTLKEVYDTLMTASSKTLASSRYWQELQTVNFFEEIKEVNILVYFATGMDDYICSSSLLSTWVEQLQASETDILILKESAHYFTKDDEMTLYEWMKEKIENNFPHMEEVEEEETLEETLLNLLQS